MAKRLYAITLKRYGLSPDGDSDQSTVYVTSDYDIQYEQERFLYGVFVEASGSGDYNDYNSDGHEVSVEEVVPKGNFQKLLDKHMNTKHELENMNEDELDEKERL